MKLEIIEFYPTVWDKQRDFMHGTMRVKLPEYRIEILGVCVTYKNDMWHIKLPNKPGYDNIKNKHTRYPLVNFIDEDEKRQFFDILLKTAPDFIMNRILCKKNPVKFPILIEKEVKSETK